MAHLIDIGNHAAWQRAADEANPRPEQFPRPGDNADQTAAEGTVPMGMGVTATMTTVGEFLAMRREREARWRARRGIPDPSTEGA